MEASCLYLRREWLFLSLLLAVSRPPTKVKNVPIPETNNPLPWMARERYPILALLNPGSRKLPPLQLSAALHRFFLRFRLPQFYPVGVTCPIPCWREWVKSIPTTMSCVFFTTQRVVKKQSRCVLFEWGMPLQYSPQQSDASDSSDWVKEWPCPQLTTYRDSRWVYVTYQ